jgi:hypothetical protein
MEELARLDDVAGLVLTLGALCASAVSLEPLQVESRSTIAATVTLGFQSMDALTGPAVSPDCGGKAVRYRVATQAAMISRRSRVSQS